MKQKEIEKIPWKAKKNGKDLVVVAAVHDIKGEETLIIDLTREKPHSQDMRNRKRLQKLLSTRFKNWERESMGREKRR